MPLTSPRTARPVSADAATVDRILSEWERTADLDAPGLGVLRGVALELRMALGPPLTSLRHR